MIDVTAAIWLKDSRVLLGKRNKDGKFFDYWEFPGGKLEDFETLEECLVREMMEEFEVNITIDEFFHKCRYDEDDLTLILHAYFIHSTDEIKVMHNHSEIEWVSIDEITNYKLIPSDMVVAEELVKQLST